MARVDITMTNARTCFFDWQFVIPRWFGRFPGRNAYRTLLFLQLLDGVNSSLKALNISISIGNQIIDQLIATVA